MIMDLSQWMQLQTELWWAFGWLARWWLILFLVVSSLAAVMMFFLNVVSTWLRDQ